MDDPAREIPELVNVLLTGSSSERRAAIDKNFAPDATFEHPFFVVNTAEKIFWMYHAWSWMNRHNVTFDAETSALSADGGLVTVSGWTHVNPFFWSPLLPVFHVKIISLVFLAKNEEGRKVITKQHDSHIWLGSIAHNIPGFQWLYEVLWRQAFGAVAVFLMQLLYGFLKFFKLAKSDDSPPVTLMGMARALLGIKTEPVMNDDDSYSAGSSRQRSGCYSSSHLATVCEEDSSGENEEPHTEQEEAEQSSIQREGTNNIPTLSSDDSDDSDQGTAETAGAISSEPSSVESNPNETLLVDDTEAEAGTVNADGDEPHSIPPSSTPDAPHPAAVQSEAVHAQQVDTEVPQTELSSSSDHSSEDSYQPLKNDMEYDTRTALTETSEPHDSLPAAGPLVDYPSPPRSVLKTRSPSFTPSPPTSTSHASSPAPMSYSEAAIAKPEKDGPSPDTTPPSDNQAAEPQRNGPRGTLEVDSSAAAAVAAATKGLGSTPRSGPLTVDSFPTLERSVTGVHSLGRSTDTGGRAKGADRASYNGSAISNSTDPSSTACPKAPGGGRKSERQSNNNNSNRKVNNKKKKKSSKSGSD